MLWDLLVSKRIGKIYKEMTVLYPKRIGKVALSIHSRNETLFSQFLSLAEFAVLATEMFKSS